MSEDIQMNSPDGLPRIAERALARLEPEPLAVSRDDLFFQAGYAAGSRKRTIRFLWPSAAAALLLVSIGLAAALAHQIIRSSLAPGQTIAANHSPSGRSNESVANTGQRSVPADSRSQLWQRLASPTTLPPGQLTAIGWSELPEKAGMGQAVVGGDESPKDTSARPPSTYLELMRSQNQG
jgi:hypothetical protein